MDLRTNSQSPDSLNTNDIQARDSLPLRSYGQKLQECGEKFNTSQVDGKHNLKIKLDRTVSATGAKVLGRNLLTSYDRTPNGSTDGNPNKACGRTESLRFDPLGAIRKDQTRSELVADWSDISVTLQRRIDKFMFLKKTESDALSSDTLELRKKRSFPNSKQTKPQSHSSVGIRPPAFDNLTFRDDNDNVDLKHLVQDSSEQSEQRDPWCVLGENESNDDMNSKKKVLHRSCEFLDKYGSLDKSSSQDYTNFHGIVSGESRVDDPPHNAETKVPNVKIPADGNIQSFTPETLADFFQCLKVDDYIVDRLLRKKLDGRKFSKLKDSDLEDIGIKNPIICYFRDRSKKQKIGFML